MSEDSAEEIKFDQYFKKDDNNFDDDDGFDDSEEFQVHNNTQSLQKPKQQPAPAQFNLKTSVSQTNKPSAINSKNIAQSQGQGAKGQQQLQKSPFNYNKNDDDFDDDDFDEEESKHSQTQKIQNKIIMQNNDDEEEVGSSRGSAFDNAFKYDREEFKSEISDSGDNIPVTHQDKNKNKRGQQDLNNFSVKREDNPFATKKNLNENKPIIQKMSTQSSKQIVNETPQQNTSKPPPSFYNQSSFGQAQEIKFQPMKDDIRTDSDVGFDDDIQDDHFSEEPIDDDFEVSNQSDRSPPKPIIKYDDTAVQQNNQTKNNQTNFLQNKNNNTSGSTVNMASVVQNPKIVPSTQNFQNTNKVATQLQTQTQSQTLKTFNPFQDIGEDPDMENQSDIVPEIEYEREDSMKDIHEKINAIPSRFSDLSSPQQQQNPKIISASSPNQQQQEVQNTVKKFENSPDVKQIDDLKNKKQSKPEFKKQQNLQTQSQPTKSTSKSRPQTAKPTNKQESQANQNAKGRSGSKAPPLPKPKNQRQSNNNDLGEVMDDEELKNDQNNQDNANQDNGSLIEKVTKNLLQSRLKQNRIILRPESAKPKVGYDGNPNTLGKVKPVSANHNDLSTQLDKNKNFQMVQKIKQDKGKKQELTVRNLTKANVIKQKYQQTKQQQQQQSSNNSLQKKSPLIQDEFENDDFFQEADAIIGDQAVGPGMGGDGGMNDDFNDSMNRSVRQSVKDLAQTKQQDPKLKWQPQLQQQQVQQIQQQQYMPPQQTRQQPNLNNNFNTNNAQSQSQQINISNPTQGQGTTGAQNTQKAVPKQTPQSLSLQNQKEQTANKKGSVILNQTDDRFNEILRQKKDKETNKDVLNFMLEKNQKVQQDKQKELNEQVNRLAKDFTLKDAPKGVDTSQNKPSDKVPEHARLVIDDEKLEKELMDLKRRFKETNIENIKISSNIEMVERKKREKEAALDQIMSQKNLITINGSLKVQEEGRKGQTSLLYGIKLEDIPDFDKIAKEKVNPLESVVKKIESKGITLEQAFNLFDDDGDEVLTNQEIKNGLKLQKIELLDTEMNDLIKAIDANSDGVLTMEEWVNTLRPKFNAEREFREIMQNIDIEDPLILEERILDLRFRSQRIEQELEILREMAGEEQGFNHKDRMKRKLKNPLQKKYADKIVNLEERLSNKISNIMFEKLTMENKIKQSLMAKDEVHQNFYEAQRQKEQLETEYSMRLQQIHDSLNINDHKLNDFTQHTLMLKSEREGLRLQISRKQVQVTSLTEMESKLDRQLEQILGRAIDGKDLEMLYELDLKTLSQLNQGSNHKFSNILTYLASVTIQRIFRGIIGRRDTKIWKFQRERFARKLQPIVRERQNRLKIRAAITIQKIFRRYKARKQQLETLKLKNQQKKLLEEQLDQNYKTQAQIQEAARTIWRRWKDYKRRQLRDFASISKMNTRTNFNKDIEVIYIPSIRVCFICKKKNSTRLCPSCQDCFYCDDCYIEYHSRGHRKVHTYKRIRFGTKPLDENEQEQDYQKFMQRQRDIENRNPNQLKTTTTQQLTQQYQQLQDQQKNSISSSGQGVVDGIIKKQADLSMQKEEFSFSDKQDAITKATLKNTEINAQLKNNKTSDELIYKDNKTNNGKDLNTNENANYPKNSNTLQKFASAKVGKSVKLDDNGFLGSIKQACPHFSQEISLYNNDDEENNKFIRLSSLKSALIKNESIFKLNKDDVERLCEIAHSKCIMNRDIDGGDSLAQYIDLVKLQAMINGRTEF